MNESTEQYVSRITGYVDGKNHLAVLASTVKRLEGRLKSVPVKKMLKKPTKDKWSVAEILSHLAETEIVFSYRLRLVLGANGTPIQAFDQNNWQKNATYLISDPRQAAILFHELRASNVALLKALPKEGWDRFGMHQERGKETVSRMVEMFAGHDINHLQQIETILGKQRAR